MLLEATNVFLAVAGFAKNLVGGIRKGKQVEAFIEQAKRTNDNLEKLAEGIYYQQNVLAVRDLNRKQQKVVSDLREVRQHLEPLHQRVDSRILATGLIPTPTTMQSAFSKNPWTVLDSIRPFRLAQPHPNPSMIPIVFQDDKQLFLGWQMKGIMPVLFGCEYNNDSCLWETSASGSEFVGCVYGDCGNGRGTYVYEDGVKYVGQFKNGLPHGRGAFYPSDDIIYIGEFKRGKYDGKLTLVYRDRSVRQGIWRNNVFQNWLTPKISPMYTLKSGQTGRLFGNCQNGTGAYQYQEGNQYVGEFNRGRPHGFGVYYYNNNSLHVGQFQQGKYHGEVIVVNHENEIKQGFWLKNKFQYWIS